jgi:predicted NUDIX family NTP pyrophosphohydrolase
MLKRKQSGKLPGKQSAGILLFRRTATRIEILLGHPGGPFWRNKNLGAWGIPKGSIVPDESPLAAAKREFAEETGYKPRGKSIPLGDAKQPGGKVVHVWAVESDWDAGNLRSNQFEMVWPPKSGRLEKFPELDRAAWFGIAEARKHILKGQSVFLDRLADAITADKENSD